MSMAIKQLHFVAYFSLITEFYNSLSWKKLFEIHLVQPACYEQGHLQLDHFAQSSVCPDFECFQGWGIYLSSLDNLFQSFTTLIVNNFFFKSNLNQPSFTLKPFLPVLKQQDLLKSQSQSYSSPTHSENHQLGLPGAFTS